MCLDHKPIDLRPYTPAPPPVKVASEDRSIQPYKPVPPAGALAVTAQLIPVTTESPLAVCPASNGYKCPGQSTIVLASNQLCDGHVDCPDGADERGCKTCQTQSQCVSLVASDELACLRGDQLCNNFADCADGFDESSALCAPPTKCTGVATYACANSTVCIPKSWLCDGDEQCPHGDDERACNVSSDCKNNAFFCPRGVAGTAASGNGQCIAAWHRCDGRQHCADGSDELNCTCALCSGNGAMLCSLRGRRQCVPRSVLCDGHRDCDGGEDEANCPVR